MWILHPAEEIKCADWMPSLPRLLFINHQSVAICHFSPTPTNPILNDNAVSLTVIFSRRESLYTSPEPTDHLSPGHIITNKRETYAHRFAQGALICWWRWFKQSSCLLVIAEQWAEILPPPCVCVCVRLCKTGLSAPTGCLGYSQLSRFPDLLQSCLHK